MKKQFVCSTQPWYVVVRNMLFTSSLVMVLGWTSLFIAPNQNTTPISMSQHSITQPVADGGSSGDPLCCHIPA
ncbi:MAG TPA: hypothetical protein VFB60_17415 [Ktedonobacteraceae bacterium]|nr:hypothetical protein [Ktedonobacteraceae bacterium]